MCRADGRVCGTVDAARQALTHVGGELEKIARGCKALAGM